MSHMSKPSYSRSSAGYIKVLLIVKHGCIVDSGPLPTAIVWQSFLQVLLFLGRTMQTGQAVEGNRMILAVTYLAHKIRRLLVTTPGVLACCSDTKQRQTRSPSLRSVSRSFPPLPTSRHAAELSMKQCQDGVLLQDAHTARHISILDA